MSARAGPLIREQPIGCRAQTLLSIPAREPRGEYGSKFPQRVFLHFGKISGVKQLVLGGSQAQSCVSMHGSNCIRPGRDTVFICDSPPKKSLSGRSELWIGKAFGSEILSSNHGEEITLHPAAQIVRHGRNHEG